MFCAETLEPFSRDERSPVLPRGSKTLYFFTLLYALLPEWWFPFVILTVSASSGLLCLNFQKEKPKQKAQSPAMNIKKKPQKTPAGRKNHGHHKVKTV